jgi:RNA polymerase sigma factor (sigma-70 family)
MSAIPATELPAPPGGSFAGRNPEGTLGALLQADASRNRVPEDEWVGLVHRVSSRDASALHVLYRRMSPAVFTLILRITRSREYAEELTVDVFHDLWRRAPEYGPDAGTVVAWIMNQARSRALDRARFTVSRDDEEFGRAAARLRAALPVLSEEERLAIETAYFAGLTHLELAACLDESVEVVKARIRTGLVKLRGSSTGEQAPSECPQLDSVDLLALRALTADEATPVVLHLMGCASCLREFQSLQPLVEDLPAWPAGELHPSPFLWERVLKRIRYEAVEESRLDASRCPDAFEWEEPAPGIRCRLLATDTVRSRVSMLVKLDPEVAYPSHRHAGVEELHLLDGELWIDERRLTPGAYHCAEPGSCDDRVWTGTGCTCVLITSSEDTLRVPH